MASLLEDDLFMVSRDGVNYKVRYDQMSLADLIPDAIDGGGANTIDFVNTYDGMTLSDPYTNAIDGGVAETVASAREVIQLYSNTIKGLLARIEALEAG